MSNFTVSAEHAVKILNEAFALDPSAIETLIDSRVSCNEKLANHPTIQAGSDSEVYSLSIIGLLNGIFGCDENGQGPIARMFDDETGELTGFCINTNLNPDAEPLTPNPDKPIMRCG